MTNTTQLVEMDCTIQHKGHTFTSGGAVISDQFVTCYLPCGADDSRIGACGIVTIWHGEQIGTYRITGRWRIPNSCWSTHMISVRIRLADGREYVGRSLGAGMVVNAKRAKS